jgi:hypothetical protein
MFMAIMANKYMLALPYIMAMLVCIYCFFAEKGKSLPGLRAI